MSDKTVLFIGFTWPEPSSTAAGHRILQLLQFFRDREYRTVFASAAAETSLSMNLESIEVEAASIKLNDSSFDEFISTLNPSAVVFDRFLTEEQFGWRVAECVPNALRILDTEDLHSLRRTRETLFKGRHSPNTEQHSGSVAIGDRSPTLTAWLQNDTTKREIASIYRCDLSLVISSYEMKLLTDVLKIDDRLLLHLPFMLDTLEDATIQQWPSFEERKHFICIGNGKHTPNVDAILWLKKEIWPLIRQQLPQAHLDIYGAYLPNHILQMNNPKEQFNVRGWAENALQVLQAARLNLAPLRFGAGIKGKLVDAMRTGTPSITTSIGAEGMHSGLPWGGTIENTAEGFAQAAIELYAHPETWRQSQQNGVAIVNSLYDKSRLSQNLSETIETIENDLPEHRMRNFTGAMLLHHTMASTKFMAKWISSKNRMS